jgi:hypothetical protein
MVAQSHHFTCKLTYFRHKTFSDNLDRSHQQVASKKSEIANIEEELNHNTAASPASAYVISMLMAACNVIIM